MSKETEPEPEPEPEPTPEPEPSDDKEARALWARLAPHHEASTRKVLAEFFGDFQTEEKDGATANSGGVGRPAGADGAGTPGTPGDRGRGTGAGAGAPAAKAATKAAAGQGEILNDLGAFFFGKRPTQSSK